MAHKIQETAETYQYNKLRNYHEELWLSGGGGLVTSFFHLGSIRLDFQEEDRRRTRGATGTVTMATALMGCHGRSGGN